MFIKYFVYRFDKKEGFLGPLGYMQYVEKFMRFFSDNKKEKEAVEMVEKDNGLLISLASLLIPNYYRYFYAFKKGAVQ